MKLAVITPLLFGSGEAILVNLLEILAALADDTSVITSGYNSQPRLGRIHVKNYVGRKKGKAGKLFEYVTLPLKTCFDIARLPRETTTAIFLLGNITLIPPVMAARLMRKRTILVLTGLHSEGARWIYKDRPVSRSILCRSFRLLEEINFALVDKIIGYSSGNITQFHIARYRDKFSGRGSRFVDIQQFKPARGIDERRKTVGYIGRFREEKGLLNFLGAIPRLLEEEDNIEFLIGGDGALSDRVKRTIADCPVGRITLTGWVQHDQLPEYLNRLKLLVIPSYSESGPYIAVEAMACGTPVLSTPVGFIPDVIKNGETGFIMEDNSPECIARNVKRALNYPHLDQLVTRARDVVEQDYTLEAAVARYKGIIYGE